MTLGRNLLAGLANSIWSALLGLAVVPFYLKYLGIEAYGLIGFFVTTQALLQLLDMGMAPTINREVARCSASGNLQEAGKCIVAVDPRYFRPTEVETLLGDASKAKNKLGWTPKISFDELVSELVREDFKSAQRDELVKRHGYQARTTMSDPA